MQLHRLRAGFSASLVVLLLAFTQLAEAAELTVETVTGAVGGEVEVPIQVRDAAGLEGLQFVLTYDPQALESLGVTPGALARGADLDLKERDPGSVRVALLPEEALDSRSGTLLLARFRVLAGPDREIAVRIEDARASEFRSSFPVWMQVRTTSGAVRTRAPRALPSWLLVAGGAVVLVLLGALILRRRA